MVVFNARTAAELASAQARTEEVQRIRRDDDVYEDVVPRRGDRRRIMIRTANLVDDDANMRSLLKRIARDFAG